MERLDGRCAGIRPTGLTFADVTEGFDKPGPVIDRFREAARALIAPAPMSSSRARSR